MRERRNSESLTRDAKDAPRTLPVAAERLAVGRRKVVTGRVRITKRVRPRTVVVTAPASRETVSVQRVPMDRLVEARVPDRYEGDTLVVSIVEEVPVVRTQLRLVEELRITRRRLTRPRRQRVTLQREEVRVERASVGPGPDGVNDKLADERNTG